MDKRRSYKAGRIVWCHAKEIFVLIVIFRHSATEFIRCRAAADKNDSPVHGNILHGKHCFRAETTNNKVHLFFSNQTFHGIGCISDA
ncbi:MAG: hypothetical protein BWY90_01400 [Deltaproteobacteria bacterium ADurb.BinA014]|nr:MAG: hypothetical protein BWY90_01400 [Deltaproteobacteria bacterium ADurb.BinA014]